MGKKESRNSKTYTLVITQNYYNNLTQIVDYIALVNKQPANALKIGNGINLTLNKIKLNPLCYSECENLPTKKGIYRKALFKTWLIIFKIKSMEVIVLGVLSAKRSSTAFKNTTKKNNFNVFFTLFNSTLSLIIKHNLIGFKQC